MKPQWLLSISSAYFLGRFQSSGETTGEKLIRKWPRAAFSCFVRRLTSDPAANEIRAC